MTDGAKVLIGFLVVGTLVGGGIALSRAQKKKELVNIIVSHPQSDASFSIVSQLSIPELEDYVQQMIREGMLTPEGTQIIDTRLPGQVWS